MNPQLSFLLCLASGLAVFGALMLKYGKLGRSADGNDDRRTVKRFRITGQIVLQWCDGADTTVQIESGKAIELNRFGGSVLVSRSVPIGSRVYFESRGTGLSGFGEVKRCTMLRQGYSVGVEFRGSLLRMLTSGTRAYVSPLISDGKVVAYTLNNAVVCSEQATHA